MPAYFDLTAVFRRKNLRPGFVEDFESALERAGVAFISGYREDAAWSREELAAWNQKKLEADFEPDDDLLELGENPEDYRQRLCRFGGHPEVRGYWINRYPARAYFSHTLIIPEGEIFGWDPCDRPGEVPFLRGLPAGFWRAVIRPEAARELLALMEALWQFPAAESLQTALELSDAAAAPEDIRDGTAPNACPFAVLGLDCPGFPHLTRRVPAEGRPGVLLLDAGMLPPEWEKEFFESVPPEAGHPGPVPAPKNGSGPKWLGIRPESD